MCSSSECWEKSYELVTVWNSKDIRQGEKRKGRAWHWIFYALATVEGVSYNFIVLQGNLYCFRKLGHRATVPTSLTTQNPFLALRQVLQMFLVCLNTTSAQQLDEGIVSILLPNAKVEPF